MSPELVKYIVLATFAVLVIGAAVRERELVFRYGGDEFVVLLPGITESAGVAVAERIRAVRPDAQFVVPVAPTLARTEVEPYVAAHRALEVKLVDPSGENVWWVKRRDVSFPATWQEVRLFRQGRI